MDPIWLLLLLLGKGKGAADKQPPGGLSTSPSASPSPLVPSLPASGGGGAFAAAWRKRCAELISRGAGGGRWVPRMTVLLGSPAAGAAAGRWIGIESGGRPLAASSLKERGLAQVMESSAPALGITPADWAAMADPTTSDDMHALLAAKVIAGEVAIVSKAYDVPDPGWGPAITPKWGTLKSRAGIGGGKLRHGLPLLMRELNDQKCLRPTIAETLAMRGTFKPSPRLAAFGGKAHAITRDPAQDLLIRFLGSAAVVALGDGALVLADDTGKVA
jgi:hypothetical protein